MSGALTQFVPADKVLLAGRRPNCPAPCRATMTAIWPRDGINARVPRPHQMDAPPAGREEGGGVVSRMLQSCTGGKRGEGGTKRAEGESMTASV